MLALDISWAIVVKALLYGRFQLKFVVETM